ncbi:hypothetical protein D3C86_1063290 [compost metagenome]
MASAGATVPVAGEAGGTPLTLSATTPVTAAHYPEIARRLAAALCEVLAAREARAPARGNAAAEAA